MSTGAICLFNPGLQFRKVFRPFRKELAGQPGDMTHLATRAGFRFAIQVDECVWRRRPLFNGQNIIADEVLHDAI